MKSEVEPFASDEFVLRLIWRDFFKPGEPPTISPRAFLPKPNEIDGISVFREACVLEPEAILAVIAEENRDKYGIVRLPVSALLSVGLSIVSAEIDSVAGHCVLPELNIDTLQTDPPKTAELQEALAKLSNCNVIRKPAK